MNPAPIHETPERIVIVLDGVQVVPSLPHGTVRFADTSAAEARRNRIISRIHHGIVAPEESMGRVFARFGALEKASGLQRRALSVDGPHRGIAPKPPRACGDTFWNPLVFRPSTRD